MNALTLLESKQAAQLRQALPKGGDWYVAAAVSDAELREVMTRLDDAAAEAAARLGAKRRPRRAARTGTKPAKSGR